MLKQKSFYITWIMMYAVIAIPNMLFQMRNEKRMFEEIPFVFFGAILVGALLITFVIYKNLIGQNK